MTDNIRSLLSDFESLYDNIAVFISSSRSKSVQLNGTEPENTEFADDTSLYVRAVKEGRVISSSFSGGDTGRIESFLADGRDAVLRLPADEFMFMPSYGEPVHRLALADAAFDKVTAEELTEMANAMTQAAVKKDGRVASVKQSAVSAALKETTLVSTCGPVINRSKTVFSSGIYLIASDGTDERDAYDSAMSTSLSGLEFLHSAEEAAVNACSLLGARQIKTGKYDILFSAAVMADFLDLVLELADGDNVYKGVSLLADSLGKNSASKALTLTDDPLMAGGIGSRAFDDEGQPCGKIEIFSEGVLNNFLHNSYTAKALGMDNNCHAALSGGGNIGIGSTNVSLHTTTDKKPADFCGEYLKVTEVMGMHTADTVSGDFSVGISGVYCKDGENAYPFREAVLSGNLRDLLNGLIHVFSNRRTFGNITTADTLFDKMSVSGV